MGKRTISLKIGLLLLVIAGNSVADETFVGGTTPSERPQEAPIITELEKNKDWYANALKGVTTPYPASLRFLEDQGGWYTPFTRPGMLNPYDIRGMHSEQQ